MRTIASLSHAGCVANAGVSHNLDHISHEACCKEDASTCPPSRALAVDLFSLALLNRINTLEVIFSPQALLLFHHLPSQKKKKLSILQLHFKSQNTVSLLYCEEIHWFPARSDLLSHNVKCRVEASVDLQSSWQCSCLFTVTTVISLISLD